MEIYKNYALRGLNTFGMDVKADFFAEAVSVQNIIDLFNHSDFTSIPRLILGGGSNILFTGDFKGIVIKNSIKGIVVSDEDDKYIYIKAGAGESWPDFVDYCVLNNFGGVENLSLIPGTVGASPIQNIGAYGTELKDVFYSLEGLHEGSSGPVILYHEECRFGYRDSIFKRELKNKFIITSVIFKLDKNPKVNIRYEALKKEIDSLDPQDVSIKDVSDAVIKVRKSKLPDPAEFGNAGSFFKNPEIPLELFKSVKDNYPDIPGFSTDAGTVKLPAGWLIESCGLKGRRFNNAGMFEKQALVMVNYGGASGKEILEAAKKVQDSVMEKFGIMLEPEVNII